METMVKRIFSMLLVCTMLMTMLPIGALAEQADQADVVILEADETQTGENDTTQNEEPGGDVGDDDTTEGNDKPEGDEPPTEDPDPDPEPEPEKVYADASNAQELEQALTDGADVIRITSSFAVDRTFYITKNTQIYAEDACVLTRDPAFGGDIFVVGENAEGVLCEEPVALTLGDPESAVEDLLTIDGNKDNMTVDVVGSTIFVCNNAQADLYPNLTVQNCYKVGNERTLHSNHTVSYADQVGGPVAILAAGAAMNIYGGKYIDNSVPDTVTVGEDSLVTMGGAFYNYGTLNVYGGLFQGNHAGRGGAFYNYRTLNIYKADIKENTASTLGGAIYMPNSGNAFTVIGGKNDVVTPEVKFESNTADSSGGAIYGKNSLVIENAVFDGNESKGGDGGGAIVAYSTAVTLNNVTFRNNTSKVYGAAVYLSGNNTLEAQWDLYAENVVFEDNASSSYGGAIYLTGGAKVYMEDAQFLRNSGTYGGAVMVNASTLELNGAQFTQNSATGNAGALGIYEGSTVVMNQVTGTGNTSGGNGAFGFCEASSLTVFDSEFRENVSEKAAGVWYLNAGAATKIYGTTFQDNSAATNAGAITMYTGENVEVLLHSCAFMGNSNNGEGSTGFGGALHISGKTQLKMYNITATDNEGGKGGFMYETSAGTIVTAIGLTVSGNTAREGGPVIWGNTLNAKLFVDKAKYTDLDHTGEYDDTYWASAVYNLLTSAWTKEKIGSYVNYYGQTVVPDISVATVEVATAEQLEKALLDQADAILITADIVVDRSFFVTNDVTIYTTEAHTLTRDPAFGGDIFVVGESAEGVLCDAPVVLTLGDPESTTENLLIIDGNKDNMTVDVAGSAIFVCNNAQADLYPNLTVRNCHKVGNERTHHANHTVSYPDQIGAPVAILAAGAAMNIYGGNYLNNSAPDTVTVGEESLVTMGGAFYNYGTLNVYGGLFQGNHAGRGGAFYNYRTLNIYKADIKENTASTLGGAIYMPNSGSAFTTIGGKNDVVTPEVKFESNTADSSGGVIYGRNSLVIENTVFDGNESKGGDGGGAIVAYSTAVTLNNVTFRNNTASKYGGALYISGTKGEEGVLDLTATNVTFQDNTAVSAGAMLLEAGTKVYLENVNFVSNEATTNVGGAIYTSGVTLEINGAQFTQNSAADNGGAMYITTDSAVVMNNITATENAGKNGGFAYAKACSLTIYNSKFQENQSTANGGVFYLAAGAATQLYGTTFDSNTSATNGGVMSVYSAADVEVLIHSCTFQNNSATSYGGAIHISGSSQLKLYCIKAIGNSAGNGGFLYETTTGTNVTLAGVTLTGNTATVGGPIIWGNSTGAKLYIDKAKYMDMDHTGDFDSAYWAAAIYNKLKVVEQTVDLPTYVDYDGQTVQPQLPEVTPYVTTAAQLERALKAGCEEIRITADFMLDRTFYVTSNTKIYSTEAHTLTRDPAFGGDLFVVGENAEGVLCEEPVVLTLGDPESSSANLLIIDGNKDNMTVDVVGSAIFVCNNAQADLYPNLTVQNCYKVGNERTLHSNHTVSYADQVGGPVAILAAGAAMNIYGGNYLNNSVPDTVTVGEDSLVTMGGAFYNYGILNVYGGLFQGNHAGRGGAFYNYRTLNIYKADIKENTASTLGGAIYMPNSGSAFTTIGGKNDVVTPEVKFESNTADSSGGAIYGRNSLVIENTVFDGNESKGGDGGGAIVAYSTTVTLNNVTFRNNVCADYGAAMYLSGSNGSESTLELTAKNVIFEDNTASSYAGAMYLGEGVRAYMEDAQFLRNSGTYGGAIFCSGATLEMNRATFTDNHAANNAGAVGVYASSNVRLNAITATGNTAGSNGAFGYCKESNLAVYNSLFQENVSSGAAGAWYLAAGAATQFYGTTFRDNSAATNAGAISIYSGADVEVLIHSCTFDGNSNNGSNTTGFGGALHISGASQVKLYNITATDNEGGKGGFMYETTAGTNVTLVGLTVSGNTAREGGPVIWGNTFNAKLFIDKDKYTDLDHTGAYDDAYWAAAIVNKLTVEEISQQIPKYLDYGNEPYDHMIEATDVANAQQLEDALKAETRYIRVVADFQIDRTFYITKETTIFSTITRTLTRSPNFAGDIFVVGEYADGTNALIKNGKVKLTLGNPQSAQSDLLIIDGNKDNMAVDVVGSVVFLCNSSSLDLHENMTIRNCFKPGNERTMIARYGVSVGNRMGGSVIMNTSGTVNIYGGLYENNGIREEVIVEDAVDDSGRDSTVGGVILNRGTLQIHGGRFVNNQGARGGVIYNYYITEITGGSFIGNKATKSGGVVYQANSSAAHLRIGSPDGLEEKILFEGNSAVSTGGVVYGATLSVLVVYGDAQFIGNSATNGGALATYGQLTVRNAQFLENTAVNRGGAIYLSKSVINYTSRLGTVVNCSFEGNKAYLGGAISTYASGEDFPDGTNLTVKNTSFVNNLASRQTEDSLIGHGGAIYTTRSTTLTVEDSTFTGNHAETEAGAIYSAFNSKVYISGSEIRDSSSGKYGGALSLRSVTAQIRDTQIIGATAANNGGAIYVSYNSASLQNTDLTIADCVISQTESQNNGGVIYATRHAIEQEHRILTVLNTTISDAAAAEAGGAFYLQTGVEAVMNEITADTCSAGKAGGFLYTAGGSLKLYNSSLSNCSAGTTGGALALYEGTTAGIYTTSFTGNTATSNGGAAMVYTDGGEVTFHSCDFVNNTAENVGGVMYVSKKSQLNLYNTTATGNAAVKGGFLYVTTTGTVVVLNGTTISGNTATEAAPIIWGNSTGAKLKLNKSNFVDSDAQSALDEAYWAAAIVNLLTVEEISDAIPPCEEYKDTETGTTKPKTPVPVDDVLNLGLNSSDGYINAIYDAFPRLDNSSNFMSRNTTTFENVNGGDVSVDSFVYYMNEPAHNGTVGLGLLIYQAILYKQANPEEDVYIDTSFYRFSVQAGVNINRNSRYFGYARQLPAGKEYDQYGFVRISYLLVTAAKMGIHVTAMGQRDGYPIVGNDPDLITYFNRHMTDPCDANYVENAVVSDYLKFTSCDWTIGESKGGTDMMHLKICTVSHYLDMNGVAHRNTVFTSSSNLDGINTKGANACVAMQTSTIVSDHADIYRTAVNYVRLVHDYAAQEQIYEFQDLVNERSAQQIDMILAGNGDQIPADQQLVYLGSETDQVFELYFTPFGGDTLVWSDRYNPYCKYLQKMYDSEDYIWFTWNAAQYNGGYALGQQMEQMISAAFHDNANVNNRIYFNLEHFDLALLSDLKVGETIGVKTLNKWNYGTIHSKDVQVSYVEDGQRYYVSLLNSLNIHSGSMYYQSNFMLVVKETELTEESVFFTLADLTTKNIVEHKYGERQTYLPEDGTHGYYYQECEECGKILEQGVAHIPGQWITDAEPTQATKGIQHKECVVCKCLIMSREIGYTESTSYDFSQLEGRTFSADPSSMVQVPAIPTPKTIEALIHMPKSISDRGGVVVGNYGPWGANALNLEVYSNGNVRLYVCNEGVTVSQIFDVDVRSDGVTHIALTVDGTKAILYINGTFARAAELSVTLPEGIDGFQIGGDNREDNTQYFKGIIHAINLFDEVRTPDQIRMDAILVAEGEENLIYSNYFAKKQTTSNNYQEAAPVDKIFTAQTLHKIDKVFNATPQTIEALIRTGTGKEVTGVIVGNYSEEAQSYLNLELCEGGRVRLVTESVDCVFDADIRSEEYVHVSVTVNGIVAQLYVDGQLVQTKKLAAKLGKAYKGFVVGGDNREGNTAYFQGSIYSVSLFRDVRTAEEINKDRILVSPSTHGLLYTGSFLYDTQKEIPGKTFTADQQHSVPTLAAAPKTIEAVIQMPKVFNDRGGVILGSYGGNWQNALNIEVYYNGLVRVYTISNGKSISTLFGVDVRSGEKTHLAVTLDGTAVTLFVNGQKLETKQLTTLTPEVTKKLLVGGDHRSGNDQYFKGTIYSIGLYSQVRTEEEILSNAQQMSAVNGADLYAEDFAAQADRHKGELQTIDGWRFSETGGYRAEELNSTPHTLEALVQLPAYRYDRSGVIVGNFKNGGENALNLEIYYAGKIRLYYMNDGVCVDHLFTKSVYSGGLRHIAVTVSGLTATLYIDGEAVETAQLPVGLPAVTNNFVVGGDNRPNNSQYFKGTIYGVKLYADVRTPEEVWKDAKGVAADAQDLLFSRIFTQGEAVGEGMTFHKTSSFSVDVLAKTPSTLEATIRLSETVSGRGGVIVGNYGSTGPQMNLEVYSRGRVRLYVETEDITGQCFFETDIRSENVRHIAVTVRGNSAKLYIDGELKESAWIRMLPIDCTQNFMIGSDNREGNAQYFKGTIYNVSLFGDVRTAEEIRQDAKGVAADAQDLLFTRSFTGNECPGSIDGAHTPGDWQVVRQATETEEGLKHRNCSVCGKLLEVHQIGRIVADGGQVDYSNAPLTFRATDPVMKLDEDMKGAPVTFEFMLQLPKTFNNRAGVVFGNYTGGKEDQINIEIYNDGRPRVYFRNKSVSIAYVFKTDIRSDSMVHVAIVAEGTTAKLYLNGEFVESKEMVTTLPAAVSGYCIGGDNRLNNEQYFRGSLYAINIFEDVRTPEEIQRDMIYVPEDTSGLVYSQYFVQQDSDQ